MSALKRIAPLLLAAVLLALPAWAATKEGDKEIMAAFAVASTSASAEGQNADFTTTTLQGSFGYFFSKQLQAGAAVLQQTVSGEDFDSGATFLEGFVKFHFNPDTEIVPYVGGLLGTVTVNSNAGGESESASGSTLGAMAGVKFFISADLSVNAEYSIRNFTITIADVEFKSTTSTAMLGLAYYFH